MIAVINRDRIIKWLKSQVYDKRKRSGVYAGEYYWKFVNMVHVGRLDGEPIYFYVFHIRVNKIEFECTVLEPYRELDELVAYCIKNQKFKATYV